MSLNQQQIKAFDRLALSGMAYGNEMLGEGEKRKFIRTYVDGLDPVTEETEKIRAKVTELLLVDTADAQILYNNPLFKILIDDANRQFAKVEEETQFKGFEKITHDFTRSKRRRVESVTENRKELKYYQIKSEIDEGHRTIDSYLQQQQTKYYHKGSEGFDGKFDTYLRSLDPSQLDEDMKPVGPLPICKLSDLCAYDEYLDVKATALTKEVRTDHGLTTGGVDSVYRDIGRSLTPIKAALGQGGTQDITKEAVKTTTYDVSAMVGVYSQLEAFKHVDDAKLKKSYENLLGIGLNFIKEFSAILADSNVFDIYAGKGSYQHICQHLGLIRQLSKKAQPITTFMDRMVGTMNIHNRGFELMDKQVQDLIINIRAKSYALYMYDNYVIFPHVQQYEDSFRAGELPDWKEYRSFQDYEKEMLDHFRFTYSTYKPYTEPMTTTTTTTTQG